MLSSKFLLSVFSCLTLLVASQSGLVRGAGVIGETNKGDIFSAEKGWSKASEVLKDIKKYEENGKGSPLWLIGVMPRTLNLDCDYAHIVSTYYKAEKHFKSFARLGMIRLDDENEAESRELFSYLGMNLPEDDELECLSILRYNAKLASDLANKPSEAAADVDLDKIDNPGLLPIKASDMEIKLWHISTIITSSHVYMGSTLETKDALKNFGVDFLSAGHIPLLLYVDPNKTAGKQNTPAADTDGTDGDVGEEDKSGKEDFVDEGTDSFMHSQLWSTLSSVDAYQEVFAFGITQNETLIDIPRDEGEELKSPTYIAVLPMKKAKIVFPYDVDGNLVSGVEMVMATFDNAESKLTDYEQREVGVVAHWLSKLKDWLDMVKSHTPGDTRRAFLAKAAEAAKAKQEETPEAKGNEEATEEATEEANGEDESSEERGIGEGWQVEQEEHEEL